MAIFNLTSIQQQPKSSECNVDLARSARQLKFINRDDLASLGKLASYTAQGDPSSCSLGILLIDIKSVLVQVRYTDMQPLFLCQQNLGNNLMGHPVHTQWKVNILANSTRPLLREQKRAYLLKQTTENQQPSIPSSAYRIDDDMNTK